MQSWPRVLAGCPETGFDARDRAPSLRLPLARLLELLMILQTERFPNARRLAEACAVSRRTIYRDLATLEAAGIRVVYCPDRQGYQLARDCLLGPLQLDDFEAVGLLMVTRFYQASEPFGLARHARSGVAKVVGALPPQLRARVAQCSELLPDETNSVEPIEPKQRAIDQAILSALLRRRIVRLRVRDRQRGEVITTHLAVYRIARIGGDWALVGYSSHHGSLRSFELQSIEHAEPLDEPYSIPPRFRLERLGLHETKEGRSTPGQDVQLRVKSADLSLIERMPRTGEEHLCWKSSGELELSLHSEIIDDFVCWVLGSGDQVEVIRPQELRELVRIRANRIAESHGPTS